MKSNDLDRVLNSTLKALRAIMERQDEINERIGKIELRSSLAIKKLNVLEDRGNQ